MIMPTAAYDVDIHTPAATRTTSLGLRPARAHAARASRFPCQGASTVRMDLLIRHRSAADAFYQGATLYRGWQVPPTYPP